MPWPFRAGGREWPRIARTVIVEAAGRLVKTAARGPRRGSGRFVQSARPRDRIAARAFPRPSDRPSQNQPGCLSTREFGEWKPRFVTGSPSFSRPSSRANSTLPAHFHGSGESTVPCVGIPSMATRRYADHSSGLHFFVRDVCRASRALVTPRPGNTWARCNGRDF